MDNYPVQLVLFGLANQSFEPFCCGCAGFVISYRYSRTVINKIFAIAITVIAFLWMDDVWPAIGMRGAKMGIASSNPNVAEVFSGNKQLGVAEYSSGERSGLWDVFTVGVWDVVSAVLFVTLAFWAGIAVTRRRWNESSSGVSVPPPPPLSLPPPPMPPLS